ncbi:hypothetical protein [Microvirga alba]|uniref:Uncharacterized protein n=1 Tax=Microvirga alba TaxID=2791025 RepID=A0A931BT95_9HYPH|nr:hypothetical protein [Microvirga alba]MBF9234795.1 hypothetical protein [Microvirga alba]
MSGLIAGATGIFWNSPAPMPAEVSVQDAARLEAQMSGLTIRLLPVDLSTSAAQSAAVRLIPAPEIQARKWVIDALAGRQNLGRIVVWDNVRQDGDVVSIASAGLSTTITLTNAPQSIIMPYPKGGMLAVTGVHDGGGGITVALELATGPLPLPPMKEGETRLLPLF